MKKMLTITAIAGLLVSMSFANWTEGTKSYGGSFSWRSTTPDGGDAVTTMTIAPSVGYFWMDNVSANFTLNYSKEGDADASTTWLVGANYFMNEWYAGAHYGTLGDDMNYMRFGGGYMYGLSDGVYLNTGFTYDMGMGDYKSNTMQIAVGVSTYF
tara:strand:+ start:671 stop:1135 length:465 start_codon:yes stop_codon:yes gene_type:complete